MNKKIILASASERRRKLLYLITDNFEVISADVDESAEISQPDELVRILAERKADAVFLDYPDAVVIGADTVVYAGGQILGKPADRNEAEKFIRLLEGSKHYVYTGVCIICGNERIIRSCSTEVEFIHMNDKEIGSYLDSGDYTGKAGAYAIQGEAAKYIRSVNGCFYNVVGLPVAVVYEVLKQLNQL